MGERDGKSDDDGQGHELPGMRRERNARIEVGPRGAGGRRAIDAGQRDGEL